MIELEAAEAEEVPSESVAVTANVYAVPLCSPATVIGLEEADPVNDPGLDVAVKLLAIPPEVAGVNVTVAAPLL